MRVGDGLAARVAAARGWARRAHGGAVHGAQGAPNRRALYAVLSVLVGLVLVGSSVLPSAGQTAYAAIGAATPSPTANTTAPADDYALGQPMAHYMGRPDSWTWRATLPGARVILYFGIVGVPYGGVIGWYGSDEAGLLNQLRNQAQAYAQVDPAHPVVMGLDIVNPLADGQPQQNGLYIDRMDPSIIQHYVDLAHQNHMVFFMDMQIERSTVQRELAYIWPYLQLPWVNLALDPEWDESHDGQSEGCGLNFDPNHTGRAYASEVNYLSEQLSALVTSKHLPPKILIVHQYLYGENPANAGYCNNAKPSEGWQNIQLRPGVQLVVNTDGVGAPGAKAGDYIAFDHDQHIQYAGIKIYYDYPGLAANFEDSPVMTPSQVLSLNPAPQLIMYQ